MMKRGFTLIELSVVLAVLAVVMAGGLSVLTVNLQQTQYDDTLARIAVIEKALADYAAAFGRLPCPANLTLNPTDSYYGAEAGTFSGVGTGECYTSVTPAANYKSSSGAEEGAVPTRTLQLPDSYMYDAWGRKFRYAVNPDYTGYTFHSKPPFPGGICYSSSKGITVKDAAGIARTGSAAYVLLSHGANGHGAYSKTGGRVNGASSNSDEITNCHWDPTTGDSTYNAIYVQHTPNYQTAGTPASRFDDVVAFRIPWQLQSQNSQISSSCGSNILWFADYSHKRIVEINTQTGAYITSISSTTSPAFTFGNTSSIALDRAGNIWVADSKNRVVELDSSGNWKMTIGGKVADKCAGTANGGSCNPISLYDSVSSSTCCVPSSGLCSCTSGSAKGQFNNTGGAPTQIAFDRYGNLWVTDYYNSRLQEFDSNGAWKNTVPLSGNPAGLVIDAYNTLWIMENGAHALYKSDGSTEVAVTDTGFSTTGLPSNYAAIDVSGNIWVTDEGNDRVSKFTSGGTYVNSLALTGIYQYTGVYFDAQNYVWLTSEDTNALYQVNPSTGAIQQTITTANGTSFSSPQLSFSNAR